jgi:protein Mpv17
LIFVSFTVLNTPLNCYWQAWLEDTFPTSKPDPIGTRISTQSEKNKSSGKRKIDIKNTVIKFALDQTLGATFNTVLFIAGIGALKGMGTNGIIQSIKRVWSIKPVQIFERLFDDI